MPRRLATTIAVAVVTVTLTACAANAQAPAAEVQSAGAATLSADSFGIDFWGSDAALWGQILALLDQDSVPLGLVGFGVGWDLAEPAPPSGGVHTYDWSLTDDLLGVVAASGRVVDLEILSRNEWGTVVPLSGMDEACCDMSPPKEDVDCDVAAYGTTCWQAWSDFVFHLVERYDGDGLDDAPGITSPVIKYLQLGNEPDSPGHFVPYGGTAELYDRMLEATFHAAKQADPNVLVVRGKSNPGNTFDDDPTKATAEARAPGPSAFLSTTLSLGEGDFDLFAINFNDHYTGLAPFSAWLQAEMATYGYARPLMVGDARMTPFPRDNDGPAHILPPRYPAGFINTLRDPSDPAYAANKRLYQADEVRQTLRKLLIAVALGQEAISLQPALQGANHPRDLWQDAGLIDTRVWSQTGDLLAAREPVYYATAQLLQRLVGADAQIDTLDLGPNVFAYRVSKGGTALFFLWHEDPFDVDAQGLVRRGQQVTVDLSPFVLTPQVRMVHFVTEIDSAYAPVYAEDTIMSATQVTMDETPVLILEEPVVEPPVGGIADLPAAGEAPLETSPRSGTNVGFLAGIVAAAAAAAIMLAGAAWHAGRAHPSTERPSQE